MCNHELKHLMGVAGGVVCRNCGQHFDHIPKQDAAPVAEDKPAKKAPAKKPAARKGAKA